MQDSCQAALLTLTVDHPKCLGIASYSEQKHLTDRGSGMDLESHRPGVLPWPCHCLTVWPWAHHLTFIIIFFHLTFKKSWSQGCLGGSVDRASILDLSSDLHLSVVELHVGRLLKKKKKKSWSQSQKPGSWTCFCHNYYVILGKAPSLWALVYPAYLVTKGLSSSPNPGSQTQSFSTRWKCFLLAGNGMWY